MDNVSPVSAEELRLKPGHCYKCRMPLVDNPHPEAGKPAHYLEVGCQKECLPCMVLSRHQWANRAMKAERELRELRATAASAAPVEQAPVKTIAWACIVDGAWHGSFKHEIDAKEAGFSTGKRFDLLPLCFAFEVDALQAKIDALMLEYCTEEMTAEQSKEWEKHQRPWVEPTPQAHTVAVEWMPIEKAPKDGSKIILGCPENEDQAAVSTIGWWQEAEEDGIDYMGADAGFVDFEFQVFNPGRSFGNRQYVAAQPTHYMPLPAAPTAQEYHSKSICNTINQPHRDGLTD